MNKRTTQTALVVGGSGVIGQSLCRCFAQQGWKVGVHFCTREDRARSLVHDIMEDKGLAGFFHADVTNRESVDAMMKQVIGEWGHLDVLVYAAGMSEDRLIARLAPEVWDHIIRSNLTGAFHCLQSVSRVFQDHRQGSVIIIGSLSSIHGRAGQAAYAASKAGLLGLVKSAAREWGASHVRVNAVFPGWHHSPISENALGNHDYADQILGHAPQISKVTDLVFHLATANDISGQIFNLDNRIF